MKNLEKVLDLIERSLNEIDNIIKSEKNIQDIIYHANILIAYERNQVLNDNIKTRINDSLSLTFKNLKFINDKIEKFDILHNSIKDLLDTIAKDKVLSNEKLDALFETGKNYIESAQYNIADKFLTIVVKYSDEQYNQYISLLENISYIKIKQKQFTDAALYNGKILQLCNLHSSKANTQIKAENNLLLIKLYIILDIIGIDNLQIKAQIKYNSKQDISGFKYLAKIANSLLKYGDYDQGKIVYHALFESFNLFFRNDSFKTQEMHNIHDESVNIFQRIALKESITSDNVFIPNTIENINKLFKIRNSTTLLLNDNENQVRQYLNEQMFSFVQSMLKTSNSFLEDNIDNYSIIGLGSLARRELCPYSDIELMILTKDNLMSTANSGLPETRQWFKTLIELIRIQILELGETSSAHIPLLTINHGIRIDSNYFPSINNEENKLIGTVTELFNSINGSTVPVPDFTLMQDTILLFEKNGYKLFEKYKISMRKLLQNENRSTAITNFVENCIKECVSTINSTRKWLEWIKDNPIQYSIIALGALANKEFYCSSKLELKILTQSNIKDEETENQYFQDLINLIRHKIEIFEEENFPELRLSKGLSIDFNSFISKDKSRREMFSASIEEIQNSIKNYPNRVTQKFIIRNDFIIIFEQNGKEIFNTYKNLIQQLTKNSPIHNIDKQPSIRELLPVWLSKELESYDSSLFDKNNKIETLNIKNDLLRFPMLLANRIFSYYVDDEIKNEGQSHTIKRIEKLSPNIFNVNELAALKEWINYAYTLRVKSHLEAGYEQDELLITIDNREIINNLYTEVIIPISQKIGVWIKEVTNNSQGNTNNILSSSNNNQNQDSKNFSKNIASLYLTRSKELMKKYHDIKNHDFLEQANWYFEKAAEMSLNTAEHWWQSQLSELGNQSKTHYSLEFIDNFNIVQSVLLDPAVYLQLSNINNDEIEGTRIVKQIYYDGNYFHFKYLPEMPGIEYAVSSLSHLICGYTTAPFNILAKLTNHINNKSIPVLVSKSVIGEKLSLALEKNDNIWKEIDSESFSLAFLRTILTNPEDDQPGNFIIQKTLSPNGEIKSRIFCIDNDHGFLTNIIQKSMLGYEKMMIKSILYCAREKMEEQLHEIRLNNALTLDLNNLLEKWLKKLIKTDENNRNLFGDVLTYEEIVEKHGKKNKLVSNVTMMLEDKVAVNIYYKLMQIKNFLGEKGVRYSYIKLLNNSDLIIGTWYSNLLVNPNLNNSKARFEELSKGQYTEVTSINSQNETIRFSITQSRYLASTLAKQPSPKEIKERKYSPNRVQQIFQQEIDIAKKLPSLRDDFINNQEGYIGYYWNNFSSLNIRLKEILINGQLPGVNIEGIKNNIFYSSSSFKHRNIIDNIKSLAFTKDFISLNLSNLTELTNADLEYILPITLKWLDISNCSKLSEGIIDIISRRCPALETLYIGHNSRKIFFKATKIFNTLLKLNLNDSPELNDKDLLGILTNFPSLKILEFKNCLNIKSTIFKQSEMLLDLISDHSFLYQMLRKHDIHNIEFINKYYDKNYNLHNSNSNSILYYLTDMEEESYRFYKPLFPLYALNQNIEMIKLSLILGIDINETSENGRTALSWAASQGYKNIVSLLIKNGAKNKIDNLGYTPLIYAAANGYEDIVRLLINKFAQVCHATFTQETALSESIKAGNIYIVKLLIDNGAQVEGIDKSTLNNLIEGSIKRGYLNILNILIHHKINLDIVNKNGESSLIIAIRANQIEVVKLFVSLGFNLSEVSIYTETPLIEAVRCGDMKIAKLLIYKGVKIHQVSKLDESPLTEAIRRQHFELVQLLVHNGSYINQLNKFGETPLVEAIKLKDQEIALFLIEKGSQIDRKIGANQTTALLVAIKFKCFEVVKSLIAKGADINTVTLDGRTPLIESVEMEDNKMVELLTKHGVNVNQSNNNITPLWTAIYKRNEDIIKLLLNKGADFDSESIKLVQSTSYNGLYKLHIFKFLEDRKDLPSTKWVAQYQEERSNNNNKLR